MTARSMILVVGIVAAAGGGLGTVAAAGDDPTPQVAGPTNPELASQGVVWHGKDLGQGERVLLVVGGSFPTRDAAETANAGLPIGDIQGYYVVRTDQFEGLNEHLGPLAQEFVLATAFRTDQGAQEFLELAAAAAVPAELTPRLKNRGYEYVGLGQEPHPDGSGPLIGPLPGVST